MSASHQIHPACLWLPELPPDQYAELKADIAKRGLVDPILRKDGFIIDGRHRLQACEELGVEPIFVEFEGTDIIAEIASRNLFRRHLPAKERAALVIKMCGDSMLAEAEARRRANLRRGEKSPDVATLPHRGRTVERIAKIAKVSPRTATSALADVKRLISKKPKPERKPRKKIEHPVMSDEWRYIVERRFTRFIGYWPIRDRKDVSRVLLGFVMQDLVPWSSKKTDEQRVTELLGEWKRYEGIKTSAPRVS
jgi:hypothetical protein